MRSYWTPALLALAVLSAVTTASAASLSGADILKRALNLQAAVRDYSADLRITVDMPGVKMPERSAKVYFKRPDKVKLESRGVVMVPKKALMMGDLGQEMAKNGKVTLVSQTVRDGAPLYFLKLTPTGDRASSDRVLVWVRGDRFTVEKLEAHYGGRRELSVTWQHHLVGGKHWLPRQLKAEVPARRLRSRREEHGMPPSPGQPSFTGPGRISVTFSNVRVNTGLPDSLFVEPKTNAQTSSGH